MIGLPRDGQKVRIWPFPGRKIQDGPRPVDCLGGGRWLDSCDDGREVVWSAFYHEQLRCGDIMLHAYKPAACALKTCAPEEAYNPHKAMVDHMRSLEPASEAKREAKVSKKDKE